MVIVHSCVSLPEGVYIYINICVYIWCVCIYIYLGASAYPKMMFNNHRMYVSIDIMNICTHVCADTYIYMYIYICEYIRRCVFIYMIQYGDMIS